MTGHSSQGSIGRSKQEKRDGRSHDHHFTAEGPFTEGDVTVDVQIYRLEDTKWSLESTVRAHRLYGMINLTRMVRRGPSSIEVLSRKGL